jgi:1,2-diacylglycerol 3-beta-glucosyltransferase
MIARQLLGAVALFLISLGLAYFIVVMGRGALADRRWRRRGLHPSLGTQQHWNDAYTVVVLIPCLNEERVIRNTIRNLLREMDTLTGGSSGVVVVIDDGSDDATSDLAFAFDPDDVAVVRRELPHARQGKGVALNHAYRSVLGVVEERGLDPEQVLICVMDADGALSAGALNEVIGCFSADKRVGGVQLAVRIRNRDSLITRLQDMEFWVLSAVSQLARARTGTVSLGGNGQFCRLSALQQIGPRPWSDSLTEDLDLAISLSLNGWRLTTAPGSHVHQQGVDTYRRLLRQRTRWYQGTIMCSSRIGDIWRSPYLRNGAALEMCLYLMLPLLLVLPWSIVFHLVAVDTYRRVMETPAFSVGGSTALSKTLGLFVWFLFSFFPNLSLGYLYARRDSTVGRLKAVLYAFALIPYNYIAYAATWAAVFRIICGKNGWSKTTRSMESVAAT